MAEDNGNNLGIQRDINKVLQERSRMLTQQSQHISSQVRLAMELCNALDCKDLEGMEDRLKGIQDGLSKSADEAERMGGQTRKLTKDTKGQSDEQKNLEKKIKATHTAAIGFFTGMYSGFKASMAQTKALIDGVFRLGKAFMSVGQSILAIPFKMLSGLIEMSNMFSGAAPVIKQAWEEVRKEFGNLAGPTGSALKASFKDIRSQSRNLAGSGLSLRRIFGPGREGLAGAIKFLNEHAAAMGPLLENVRHEFKKSGDSLVIFVKGLGLTAENLKAVTTHAFAAGKTMVSALRDMTKYSKGFAKRFNMDSKVIARDMATMAEDFEHFGQLSQKEMAETAVYARRLGVEVKALGGIMDKFLNFEDAAESAANLQQALGMQIDSIKMMNLANKGETGPMLDMIRSSLAASGKTFDQLNQSQRRLLATQTGLDQQTLATAMSQANAGKSMEQVAKAGDKLEKSKMSEREATKALGKDVDKVYQSGSKTFTGFADAVSQGFNRGIMKGKGFRKMLRNVRGTMMEFYRFGVRFGKLFIDEFPGIQNVVQGLSKLFDPKKWKGLLAGVLDEFKIFFRGGAKDLDGLLNGIGRRLTDFFGANGEAVKQIMDGFKTISLVIVKLIGKALPMAIRALADVIKAIASYIRKPPEMRAAAHPFVNEFWNAVKEAFFATWEAISEELWPAMKELWSSVWEKHKEKIIKVGMVWVAFVTTKMMIAGVASALKGAAMFGVVSMFTNFFKKATQMAGNSADGKMMAASMCGMGQGLGQGLSAFVTSTAKIGVVDIAMLAVKLALISAALWPALKLFAYGLKGMMKVFSDVPLKDTLKLFLVLAGIGPSMVMFAIAMRLLPSDGWVDMAVKLVAMAAMMPMLGVFIIGMAAIVPYVAKLPVGGILKLFLLTTASVTGLLGTTLALKMLGSPASLIAMKPMLLALGIIALGLAVFLGIMVGVTALVSTVGVGSVGKFALLSIASVGALLGVMLSLSMLQTAFGGVEGMFTLQPLMIALGIIALGTAALLAIMVGVTALVSTVGIGSVGKFALLSIGSIAALIGVMAALQLVPSDVFDMAVQIAGLVVLMAATVGFMYAVIGPMKKVQSGMPAVSDILSFFLAVYMAIGAVAMLAGVGTMLGALSVLAPIMAVGIIAAAVLVAVIMEEFLPHIVKATKQIKAVGSGEDAKNTIEAIFILLNALGQNLGMFMSLGFNDVLSRFGFGQDFKGGIIATGKLAQTLVDSLLPPLGSIMTSISAHGIDVKGVEKTINAMTGIVAATAPLTDIAKMILTMDNIAGDPKKIKQVSESMVGLFSSVLGSLEKMVTTIIEAVKKFKSGDVKKAMSIGKLMDGMGKLLAATMNSEIFKWATLEKRSGGSAVSIPFLSIGSSSSVQRGPGIEKAFAFIKGQLDTVIPAMLDFLKSMLLLVGEIKKSPAMAGISSGEMANMMDVMAKAAEVIGNMAESYSKMMAPFLKLAGPAFKTGSKVDPQAVNGAFQAIQAGSLMVKKIMSVDLRDIIKNLMGVAAGLDVSKRAVKQMKMAGDAIGLAAKFAAVITTIANLIPASEANAMKGTLRFKTEQRLKNVFLVVDGVLKILSGTHQEKTMSLADFVGKMADVAGDPRLKKVKKQDFQKVKIAMEAVGAFAAAMSSASSALKNLVGARTGGGGAVAAGEARKAQSNIDGLVELGDVMIAVLMGTAAKGTTPAKKGFIDVINSLGKAAKGIKAKSSQIKKLVELTKATDTLAKTMSSLGAGHKAGNFDNASVLFDSLSTFLTGGGTGTSFKHFITTLTSQGNALVSRKKEHMTTLHTMADLMNVAATSILGASSDQLVTKLRGSKMVLEHIEWGSLLGFFFGNAAQQKAFESGNVNDIGGFFGFLYQFSNLANSNVARGITQSMGAIKTLMDVFLSIMDPMRKGANMAIVLGREIGANSKALKDFGANSYTLARGFASFAAGLTWFPKNVSEGVVESLSAIAEMNQHLIDFSRGAISVRGVLREFGEKVKLDDLQVKIERGEVDVKWNIDLTIEIDAEEIAGALSSQKAKSNQLLKSSAASP